MKNYEKYSKEDLIKHIAELEKQLKSNKYGLYWDKSIEKEVIAQMLIENVPVFTMVEDKKINLGNFGDNILIEGDNFHALTLLNMLSEGKGFVDAIYIDPPYNTGSSDWKYNNNYVDSTDSYRHSKWLDFMEKRLVLAREVLKDDGVICVTIDDYEMPNLWLLMDKIFGYDNHLGTVVIRNNPKGRMTQRKFSLIHEYALFFGKSANSEIKKLDVDPEDKTHTYVKDTDDTWYLPVNLRKQGVDSSAYNRKGKLSERYYPIYIDPNSLSISTEKKYPVEIWPIDSKGEMRIWRREKSVIDEMAQKNEIWAKEIKGSYQLYYKFRGGLDGARPQSIWTEPEFSASDYGTKILDNILGKRELFQYPKAPAAIKKSILSMTNKKDALILDFFAGSGTTGHAVLELNQEDEGNRRFILCTNNESNICTDVTYPRLKTVITGNRIDGTKYGDGVPANLHYFKTDFIPNKGNSDQIKYNLIEKVSNLLCIAENAYNLEYQSERFYIYSSSDKTKEVFVYIDYYEKTSINNFKDRILKSNATSKIVYIFSTDNVIDEKLFEGIHNIITKPIPSKIYDIYKEIVEEIKRG